MKLQSLFLLKNYKPQWWTRGWGGGCENWVGYGKLKKIKTDFPPTLEISVLKAFLEGRGYGEWGAARAHSPPWFFKSLGSVASANGSSAWSFQEFPTGAKPTYSNWKNKHKLLCALGPKHCEKIRHHTCGCCLIKVLTEPSLLFSNLKTGFLFFFFYFFLLSCAFCPEC